MTTRQQPGQRGQDRPVSPAQPRSFGLTLEDGDLVAQDEDLGVLGAVGAGEQGNPAEDAEHCQKGERPWHGYRQCRSVWSSRSKMPNLIFPGPAEDTRSTAVTG